MIPSHFYCLVFSFVVDLGLTRVQECREESFILSAMSSVKQRNCILSAYPVMFVTLKAFSSFLFAHIAVFVSEEPTKNLETLARIPVSLVLFSSEFVCISSSFWWKKSLVRKRLLPHFLPHRPVYRLD